MDNAKTLGRWHEVMMPVYAPALVLTHGEGVYVWDADGSRYLDLTSGVAVNSLGHAHPAVAEAVSQQSRRLIHSSNLFANEPSVELAERLTDLLGEAGRSAKVFFCNSGAEANEAAFKLARKSGRRKIVAAQRSFHGRTMGALAVTGQPAKRQPFEPLPGDVTFVPYGDIDALRAAVDTATAAIFLEPVQGEGGIIPPPDGYLEAARATASENGALFILDEVQTGIGRTGAWFGYQWSNVTPDVITLAKGLGGGIPIGACIAIGDAAQLFEKGDHASTFGGNPVACAAANAVIDTIAVEGLVEHAATMGRKLALSITELGHPIVKGIRGRGLMLAMALTAPLASRVEEMARQHGFLVNMIADDLVRLAPPLIISNDEVDSFVTALPNILDDAMGMT